MAAAVQSDYFHTLDLDTKKRYLAKTSLIGGVDPYALKQQDLSHAVDLLPLLRYISNMWSVYCCVATRHDKWSQHLSHGWVWYIYSCNLLQYCYILRTELQLDIHLCFFTSATLTSLCTYFTQQVLLPWKKWEITKVLLATSISQQDGSWMLDGDTMITQAVLLSLGKCVTATPVRSRWGHGWSSSRMAV